MAPDSDPVYGHVNSERNQDHRTRQDLYRKIEENLGRPVVSLFTSFIHPVMLEDEDTNMLTGVLETIDLSRGLALIINSPGGDGLAAERMINVCRKYSKTGEYWAVVPGKAKSAATMVCFGASKIFFGPSAELGPVDPQYAVMKDGRIIRCSACNLVDSYTELFDQAVQTKGHLEPFIQQLSNYDSREIKELQAAIALAKDISIRTLKSGMMAKETEEKIAEKIAIFLSPKNKKVHGRPIYYNEAKECGLNIEELSSGDENWKTIYELYVRTNSYVSSSQVSKCVESKVHSFVAATPDGG
jgi:ClpP class serine protease